MKTELKLKSLNNIISSRLIMSASHVQKIHNPMSVIITIALFEYRGSDKMVLENSLIILDNFHYKLCLLMYQFIKYHYLFIITSEINYNIR